MLNYSKAQTTTLQETPLCQEQLCLSQTELTQRSFFKYVIAVVGVIKAITIVNYNIGVSISLPQL